MTDASSGAPLDTSRRFLFDDADIRGESVRLQRSYRDILDIHQYAPGVSRLIGEFLAASVLLSTTLKFEGRLILQVRSEGQVPLLMAECDHNLQVRSIARGAQTATALDNELLLTNGQLAITIDPLEGKRYQGIVPLHEDSLAHSLDAYFEHSEQLGTRIWLAADGEAAGGLLLQQLPAQIVPEQELREQQWEHARTLAATVTAQELLTLDAPALLLRLYREDPVRLFESRQVTFCCSCSRERTRSALASLGRAEVEELLQDLGVITMDCEFCNQQYRFDSGDLEDLLQAPQSKTLH
ncbi:MAG: Hsp33 family molecular chaperone HslO [Halioglobus sp.]|nr:Hsp33 family molecular chaperone HslO [Halioglobus sp.]